MKEFIVGFSSSDNERIRSHIRRLIPHLKSEKYVFVGGLAIRYGLIKGRLVYPDRHFNDIDLIAEDLDVISSSITDDFLTYHFHYTDKSFYFAFVDPITKIKVDIFDWSHPAIYPEKVEFEDQNILLVNLEDQLTVTVLDILNASEKVKRDPKMISDMELMLKVVDLDKASEMWEKREKEIKLPKAIQKARSLFKTKPEFFKEKPWYKPRPYKCSQCVESSNFPIIPMQEIYSILGYVE